MLYRTGEEPEDIERAWFKAGRVFSSNAKLVFEEPPEDFYV
jgi:hypothetical protein